MKFLVDAQLPPALASWLCEQGHEAQHVQDVGLRGAEDHSIWDYALSINAVILTKDEDFAERSARDSDSPVIVWLRLGNSTNRVLLLWLWSRWPQVLMLLDQKHRLIEVR